MLWAKQPGEAEGCKGRTGVGLGSCLGTCPALQPWLASALLPALLSQAPPLHGDHPSGCALALRWVCFPAGRILISCVPHWAWLMLLFLEWMISLQCLTEPAMHDRALQLQFSRRLGKNSIAFPCCPNSTSGAHGDTN